MRIVGGVMKLNFDAAPQRADRKTAVWAVNNEALRLGEVRWYAHWRRYVFFPGNLTLFDAICLRAIASFCEQRTRDHNERLRAEKAQG